MVCVSLVVLMMGWAGEQQPQTRPARTPRPGDVPPSLVQTREDYWSVESVRTRLPDPRPTFAADWALPDSRPTVVSGDLADARFQLPAGVFHPPFAVGPFHRAATFGRSFFERPGRWVGLTILVIW